jgi:predicted lipoprotein with Yx(FWY)xxD motif
MRYRRWAPALLAVPAVWLAACGGSSSPGMASGGSHSGSGMSSSGSGMSSSGSGMSSSGSGMASGPATLEKMKTMIGPVLADSKGFTLYWYAKDTKMTSACTGGCATAWPPVTGKPVAAMGAHLVGVFGTITRPGGVVQATYKGHPLYTYSGDSAPGQTKGNGVGGLWHVLRVTTKGAVAAPMASPMASASHSSSGSGGGGGGGYGY